MPISIQERSHAKSLSPKNAQYGCYMIRISIKKYLYAYDQLVFAVYERSRLRRGGVRDKKTDGEMWKMGFVNKLLEIRMSL